MSSYIISENINFQVVLWSLLKLVFISIPEFVTNSIGYVKTNTPAILDVLIPIGYALLTTSLIVTCILMVVFVVTLIPASVYLCVGIIVLFALVTKVK